MPDGKTHRRAGRVAGGVYAAHQAKNQCLVNCAVETTGGVFGGDIGARLSDVFEPGTSSWHRGPAHSCAAGVGILSALGEALPHVVTLLRETADKKAEQRKTLQMTPDPPQPNLFVPKPDTALTQFFLFLAEIALRLLAGFVNGIAAGYVSHLVLDAGTPRSIPLVAGRF
jgi:hypothetical protein